MKLSILIVNWNTRNPVIQCVTSVLRNAPSFEYEAVIVDNNSEDGSFEALRAEFGNIRSIKLLRSAENLGFAKGNNLAYANSRGEYVLLLNPDAEIRDSALQKLVDYMDKRPSVGVVGPKLLDPDGTLQPSVRRFPGVWSSVLVFSGLHRVLRPRKYLMDDFDYQTTVEVDQVMGAALLTRRRLIEQLGFLDENFWLWYEEVDFCKRVKDAGYKIMFYPEAVIVHEGAKSFSQMSVYARKKTVAKSLLYYFRKHGSRWQVFLIGATLPIVLLFAGILGVLEKVFSFKLRPHV